jgi:cholesterol oxidase
MARGETRDFDAVVVGSGFGGSVVAHRLSDAGWNVCLLERGKPYPPGSFPRSPREMARNFWDPSKGLHGLFDVWTFTGLEALVSSGLGGGSLIYANVLLRKDERWFVRETNGGRAPERWPVTREELDPHYDRVEEMIRPQRYPFDVAPYSGTPKTRALRQAAGRLGLDWSLPNLAVTFANEGEAPVPGQPIPGSETTLHGRSRSTCTLCGECDIGCNTGSKNTLDFNYLSRFKGSLETRAEVRTIEPLKGGGFAVSYVRHDPAREGRPTPTRQLPVTTITARRLVLSGGSLGTTYLLLRNRSAFPRLSPMLGKRFCGNGDLLGFVSGARERRDGGRVPRPLDPSFGPVITSAIRVPDAADPNGRGRGFYIEDGGYPQFVNWMVEAVNVPGVLRRAIGFGYRRLLNAASSRPISNISAEMGQLLGDGSASSSRLTLLGMGRDMPDGTMRLRGRYLEVDWTTRSSRAYFARLRGAMAALASSMGGRFTDNPIWYLQRVITVHPLGGCPMGTDPREGVVDPHGQAFGYPGLSIADGSVMPGPVGANPALTIAAVADRTADRILEEG